jgi:hypothetical protein
VGMLGALGVLGLLLIFWGDLKWRDARIRGSGIAGEKWDAVGVRSGG